MESLGRKAQKEIPGFNSCASKHVFALDCAHDEAGEIVFTCVIHPGHFGGFTTDKRAAVSFTTAGDTGDDAGANFRLKLADGKIVEEKKRCCTLNGDIVNAVIHEIFTDCVVSTGGERDLQLGADSVSGTDQNRVAPTLE